jgi:2-(1,2-epoxy-1,2-dihydrophenyl)acetyl-CoA isomerase
MPDLIEAVEHGVATLTLNRPGSLNALSEDIRRACRKRIVLTGAGRGFCAGGDVKSMADRSALVFEERAEGMRRSNRIPTLMHAPPKVIIGMATACDLRIAGRSARFGTGFVRIGLSGDWGGTWTLTRLVGTAKARELFFTGDMIGAEEALRIGLVNRVVEDAELADVTMALARRIAAMPLVALGYAKRKLAAAETGDFAASLELEAVHPGTLFPDRGSPRGGSGVQGKAPAGVQGVDLGTV